MSGHRHNATADTINQGNALGDRSCVRQSKLYRQYEGGNDMKSLLGTSHLCWDASQKQGAYDGQKVYDFDEHQDMVQGRQQPTYGAVSRKTEDYGQDSYGKNNYSSSGGNDYGYAPKNNNYSNNNYSSAPSNPQVSYGRHPPAPTGGGAGGRPYGGEDSTDYSTSNSGYGVNRTTKNYGGGGGMNEQTAANTNNYRRRESFSNDENQYRNQGRGDEGGGGGVFPMNKMGGGGSGGGGDDNKYRNVREQATSSTFKSRRNEYANDNNSGDSQAVRTFHGGAEAGRSTRPW